MADLTSCFTVEGMALLSLADNVAGEIGETGIKAGAKAAQEAAQAAAEAAAKKSFAQSAKATLKNAAAKAAAAAKEAVEKALKGVKETAEAASKSAKEAAESTAKGVGKDVGKESSDSVAKKALAWAQKNPKLLVGGVAAASVAGLATQTFLKNNNKKLTIARIENAPTAGDVQITFLEGTRFSEKDQIDISGTDSVPSIDGTAEIARVLSGTQVVIKQQALTVSGTKGRAVLKTSFENVLNSTVQDAVSHAVTGASGVVSSAVSGLTDGVAGSLGIDVTALKRYILVGAVALAVLVILWLASKVKWLLA